MHTVSAIVNAKINIFLKLLFTLRVKILSQIEEKYFDFQKHNLSGNLYPVHDQDY